jgi:hypothetical protein
LPPRKIRRPSTRPRRSNAQEIANAVIRAYRLETAYWQDPRRYSTWQALYAHYRQGFSADIAEQMTAFTLGNDGDMATWVPAEVFVIKHDDAFALAWFRTPKDFTDGPWALQPFMVVRLRLEQDRWVIDWATDSATPPTTTPLTPE